MSDGLGACSICLVALLSGDDTVATTPCGHAYHYRCILQSIQYKASCPNCCAKVEEEQLHRLAACYVAGQGGAAGGGAGEVSEESVHEMRRRLQGAVSHAEHLAAEAKKSSAEIERLSGELQQLGKLYRAAIARQQDVDRQKARLWEEARKATRRCAEMEGRLQASDLREAAESGGFEKVSDQVLSATPDAKNQYIKDLHGILAQEKKRHGETRKSEGSLRKAAEELQKKVEKYRERLKRQREPGVAAPGGAGVGEGVAVPSKRSRGEGRPRATAADAQDDHVRLAALRMEVRGIRASRASQVDDSGDAPLAGQELPGMVAPSMPTRKVSMLRAPGSGLAMRS